MRDMSNGAKINRWGRKYVFGDSKASAFVLFHKAVAGKMMEIQKWTTDDITESLWKSTIEDIVAAMADNTEGVGGTQTFVLHAMTNEEEVKSRLIMRQRSMDDEEDDDSVSSEPATSKGLLGMFMRHLDAMHRNQTIAYGNIMRASQSQLDTLGQLAEKMGEKTMSLINAHEQALSQQNERDLAAAEKASEIEMKSDMMKRFMMLLPTVAKKFGFDMGSAPGDISPEMMQFKDFLSSLSEKEYDALTMSLPPDKMLLLNEIMQKHTAQEEQGKNGGMKLPLALIKRATD